MSRFSWEQGDLFVLHESANPRGYWRECEPRLNVTSSDPRRYRKYTLAQLQDMGAALPGYDSTPSRAADDVYQDKKRAIREGAGGVVNMSRHTILGRAREMKQAGYYGFRAELADQLAAADLTDDDIDHVLDQWDDDRAIRMQETPGRVPSKTRTDIYGPGNRLLGSFTTGQLQTIVAEAEGILDELEPELLRQDQIDQLLDQVEAEGFTLADLEISPADLDASLREVEDLIGQRRAVLEFNGDDFPF